MPGAARRLSLLAERFHDVERRAHGRDGGALLAEVAAQRAELARALQHAAHAPREVPAATVVTLAAAITVDAHHGGRFREALADLDVLQRPTRGAHLPWESAVALLRASLLVAAGSINEAAAAIGAAEAHAGSDAVDAARIARLRGRLAMVERRYDDAETELRSALDTFAAHDDEVGAGEVVADLIGCLSGRARTAEALEIALEHERTIVRGGAMEANLAALVALLHLNQLDLERAGRRIRQASALVGASPSFILAIRLALAQSEIAIWQRLPSADDELLRMATLARRAHALAYEAYARYDLAFAAMDRGDARGAQRHAAAAARLSDELDLGPVRSGARLVESAAHSLLGHRVRALEILRAVRVPRLDAHSYRFAHGLFALANATLAKLYDVEDGRKPYVDQARTHLHAFLGHGPHAEPSIDAAFFDHVLLRIIDPHARAVGLGEVLDGHHPPGVAADGSFIETSHGERVSLASRPLLSRLLVALADNLRSAGRQPISAHDLVVAGWPNDLSSEVSLGARLRVALSALRGLGLGGALEHRRGGYRLASSVRWIRPGPR